MSMWDRIDRLIDIAPTLEDLRAHGLHLLAAQRWSQQGQAIPDVLRDEVRATAIADLAARTLLIRIRTILDGPVLLIKGPEVATRYPTSTLRPFHDLDLVVQEVETAQQALLAAGFISMGGEQWFTHHHHRAPLIWPGLPLAIELHESFWGPTWMTCPPTEELLATAVPARVNIDGIQTLSPHYHSILLAAHSWQHVPLRRVLDLIDIAVMSEGIDRKALDDVATQMNIGRVWGAMIRATDALFLNQEVQSWSLRLWARHLTGVTRRSVRAQYLNRWLGTAWAPDLPTALSAAQSIMRDDLGKWFRDYRRRVRNHFLQAP